MKLEIIRKILKSESCGTQIYVLRLGLFLVLAFSNIFAIKREMNAHDQFDLMINVFFGTFVTGCILFGFLTRPASILATLYIAIFLIIGNTHFGPEISNMGVQCLILGLMATTYLGLKGGGRLSIDNFLARKIEHFKIQAQENAILNENLNDNHFHEGIEKE